MNIKRIIQVAHTKLKVHRWIAWLLCAAMIGGMVNSALPALAVNENDIDNIIDDIDSTDDVDSAGDIDSTNDTDSEDTYCEHHPEHTEDCGYVEAVEGQPCTHVHDEYCGYTEAAEGQSCTHVHDDECGYVEEQPCTHEHDDECGYTEAVEGQPCTHEHDENCEMEGCAHEHDESCGYVEAEEGQPCTHGHDENCGYVEGQSCTHEHNEECGRAEAAECTHEHDDECGYVEAVEGQPCQFVCEICMDESKQIATMAEKPMPLADAQDEGLIAYFTFEGDSDSGRLHDYSGNGVEAALYKVTNGNPLLDSKIDISDWNQYFDETGDDVDALHLEDNACLVLTETEDFNDLTEITVVMKVKITERELDPSADPNQHWLFCAAPENDIPAGNDGNRQFLGVGILGADQNNIHPLRILRQKYIYEYGLHNGVWNWAWVWTPALGDADFLGKSDGPTYDYENWYEVRAVYKHSSMALYIDGERVVEVGAPYTMADYFGQGRRLYFGHSTWLGDANFKGYIDDIEIYNYANYGDDNADPIDEEKYIKTDRVVDPANTTINMFDYWLTEQETNDFNPPLQLDQIWQGKINNGHLFLFNGDSSSSGIDPRTNDVGSWNCYWYGGGNHHTYEPFFGIVKRELNNGYPRLAIDDLEKNNSTDDMYMPPKNPVIPSENLALLNDVNKQTESLDYLFDPDKKHPGKASYPDVTGLFRLDNEGYYYFDSGDTFAELNKDQKDGPKKTSEDGNKITLYKQTENQFFPFNDWSDLVYLPVNSDNVEPANSMGNQSTTVEPLNHFFGMTVTTEFQQPPNGELNSGLRESVPMTFDFSGDDDVWIFIDDVLVGDVGGTHQQVRVNIDFSTGKIDYAGWDSGVYTDLTDGFDDTLHNMFVKAGAVDSTQWKTAEDGENMIFADGSTHTLKFFYLERGNAASHCTITFNLMEPPTDRIRKTDENGDPLAGAKFELYEATTESTVNSNEWWHTADEFEAGALLTTVTSGSDGYAELTDDRGEPIPFEGGKFYILRETVTPTGYRTNPDIVLQYHGDTSTFIVVNKYETGAYASFLSHWEKYDDVNYADYHTGGTFTENTSDSIGDDDLKKGLAVMVPLYRQTDGNSFVRWLPLYGSNTNGWYTIADSYQTENTADNDEAAFIKDVALAAILQIADTDQRTPNWYLNYFEGGKYYDAYMENLPGDATRYGNGGDLRLVTLFLSEDVLKRWGLSDPDPGAYDGDSARYRALQEALRTQLSTHTEAGARNFLEGEGTSGTLRLLYNDEGFRRSSRSVIYIPNEQRELRVRKVGLVDSDDPDDSEVIYVNGAVFAIFDTFDAAAKYKTEAADADGAMAALKGNSNVLSYGVTSTVTPGTQAEEGLLIFREKVPTEDGYGYAKIDWPSQRSGGRDANDKNDNVLWLKEVFAPNGYELNENVVRIEVGNIAIYANATGYGPDGKYPGGGDDGDGITVEASLGKLSQTLVKYALGNKVDVTLQDITITKQIGPLGTNGALDLENSDWKDALKTSDELISYDLHYGMNDHALTSQYGPHDANDPLVFTADDGYIRVMPRQNQNVPNDGAHESGVHKADLTKNGAPIDLGNLFGLMNTVVVEDKLVKEPPEEDPKEENPEDPPSGDDPSKDPSPGDDPPTDPPSGNTPAEPLSSNNPVNTSAQQPPKKEEEPTTTGVLVSPQTGDNSMVVLWITLLVLSISGITALTKGYYARKRGDKGQST